MKTENIKITTQFIKLDSLLKWAGIVSSGSEAKNIICLGLISVNGETCLMRGKKVYPGDEIILKNQIKLFVE